MNVPNDGACPERREPAAPGHTPVPDGFAEPPAEHPDARARSYYLLEFCFEQTPNSYDMGYLSADPAEIRTALEDQYRAPRRPGTGIGEQVCLWVAQRGVLTHGLDLNPLIRARCADGATRSLAELRRLHGEGAGERGAFPTGRTFTVDWEAIAALLPPLPAPLAAPGDEELHLEVPDPSPVSGVPLSIDDREWLEHGWTDL
ncbi:hypothetical protein GCM10027168_36650 [Streptomyces capparidis]